jgi:hypothetical protein
MQQLLHRVERRPCVGRPWIGRAAPCERHPFAAEHDPALRADVVGRHDRLGETGAVARLRGGESENRRLVVGDELLQVAGGDVRPEVEHVEARALQHVGNHAQPQHVCLPGDRGEHHTLAGAGRRDLQWLLKRQQRSIAEACREVLLGDCQLALLPALPDTSHRGRDHIDHDRRRRDARGERLRDHCLGRGRVGAAQSCLITLADVRKPAIGRPT